MYGQFSCHYPLSVVTSLILNKWLFRMSALHCRIAHPSHRVISNLEQLLSSMHEQMTKMWPFAQTIHYRHQFHLVFHRAQFSCCCAFIYGQSEELLYCRFKALGQQCTDNVQLYSAHHLDTQLVYLHTDYMYCFLNIGIPPGSVIGPLLFIHHTTRYSAGHQDITSMLTVPMSLTDYIINVCKSSYIYVHSTISLANALVFNPLDYFSLVLLVHVHVS